MPPGYRALIEKLRAHLETGEPVRLQPYLVPMWQAFLSLSRERRHHAAGPETIKSVDIEAWARMHNVPFLPMHLEVIEAMDEVWMAAATRRMAGKESPKPLTLEDFDAAFN